MWIGLFRSFVTNPQPMQSVLHSSCAAMGIEATPKPDPPPQAAMASSEEPSPVSEEPKRASRRRSKVACRECRRRKVRCDVYQRGAPCTNCQLDQDDCTIVRNRRGRKPRQHETTQHAPDATGSPLSGSSSNASNHSPTYRQSPINILDDNILNGYRGRLHSPAVSSSSPKPASLLPDLPSYLHCDLSHVSNEDISLLQRKGCFTFPKKDLLDDLLKCYFDYVHPHVPFLDEQEFWETYLDRDPQSQHFHHTDGYHISLILFQAVLFAATPCAPLSVLRRAGYISRRVARRVAFDRVHALYSLDAERDKMVLLQTLLLMSFWRGDSSEEKDGWHWSGLAFSLAFDLCLHRQPDAHLTARQETLRRRCWWSCVLRDRLLALSEQRAPRLQLDQSDVPLLTLADYNVGLRCAISELSPGEELGKRTALSMFSLQLIRLVMCIGDGFPSHSENPRDFSSPTLETWARTRLTIHNDSLMTGLVDLDFWRSNLPEVLQRPSDPSGDDTVLSCILVHRNALQIYYQKLILAICMPRMLNAASQSELEHHSELARRSSTSLSELYNELVDRDSIHCLPSECFGSSAYLDPIYMQNTRSFEPTPGNDGHIAGIYSSVVTGAAGVVHPPSIQWTTSSPSASDTPNLNWDQRTNGIRLKQPHQLAQEGFKDENGLVLDMNVAPDTVCVWTLEDVRSCDSMSRFSELTADEPSSGTSDTTAPTPPTLPTPDPLLSPMWGKSVGESGIEGSLDVSDDSVAIWDNMLW